MPIILYCLSHVCILLIGFFGIRSGYYQAIQHHLSQHRFAFFNYCICGHAVFSNCLKIYSMALNGQTIMDVRSQVSRCRQTKKLSTPRSYCDTTFALTLWCHLQTKIPTRHCHPYLELNNRRVGDDSGSNIDMFTVCGNSVSDSVCCSQIDCVVISL